MKNVVKKVKKNIPPWMRFIIIAVGGISAGILWPGFVGNISSVQPVNGTLITISIPETPSPIDNRIYGGMLEDCNDRIIYGGVVNRDGSERPHVVSLLKPLKIPVTRWPAGTYSHEYHWENGIGPLDQRPVTEDYAWKGKDNNRFGTDEFLQWCKDIGTEPYINLNMGNQSPYGGTLQEALNWIEYVNGPVETPFGKKRAANGHKAPFHVKYWGIGNENYGPWGRHNKESDTVYAEKLFSWASAIRARYPSLRLLAVGHTLAWDKTVLDKAGSLIDLLTQHYYVTSKIKDAKVESAEESLYAPIKMETHLERLTPLINETNRRLGREDRPVRLCIDEWDNRHHVYRGDHYEFDRHDPRTQFDVAVVAGMLNAFIRQSAVVGMANYIFPVNGHGLVRTVGDSDAYRASIYYVFEQYRKWMTGEKMEVSVQGPGIAAKDLRFSLDGDAGTTAVQKDYLTYVDASGARSKDGSVTIALVNRHPSRPQQITLRMPPNYVPVKKWILESKDIDAANMDADRQVIRPVEERLKPTRKALAATLSPCGLQLIRFERQ